MKRLGLLLILPLVLLTGLPSAVKAQTPAPTPDPFTYPTSTTFTVNSANDVDDGTCDVTHCSLREAIDAANANAGGDTIAFNIPGGGPHTIQPTSALPTITDPVIIDGYTQPGASPNTNGPGLGLNTVLKIELDGTNAEAGAGPLGTGGLVVSAGGSTVRGIVINRFATNVSGIMLDTSDGNVIEGNFIGTDVTGTVALGNHWGVLIHKGSAPSGSSANTVGA